MANHTEEERRERRSERQTEYLINDLAIVQAIVGKLVSGVGVLAVTCSTVVLLGGFVGALQMKEFWFLTTVSLVIASTILDIYEYDPDIVGALGRGFFHLIDGILDNYRFCCLCCLPILVIPSVLVYSLILAVVIINEYGPIAIVVISMVRLIRHDYDGSDAANNGKLRATLFVFYCLALVHGVCSICWRLLRFFIVIQLGKNVSVRYRFDGWGRKVLEEYIEETNSRYAKGLRFPAGWNLVAYAVGLLGSVSLDDNLSGVRMLDTFVDKRRKRSIRVELLSSRRAIQNLITMLGWTTPTPGVKEMRERAARIMADISIELHIAEFPGALQCVSSLLEASPQKRHQEALGLYVLQGSKRSSPSSNAGMMQENTTTDDSRQRRSQLVILLARMRGVLMAIRWGKKEKAFKPKGTKELIHQGLLILERLAYDEHNCIEIVNTPRLLSKITAPITSQAFLDAGYDDTWVSILSSSLRVVSRLITTPGEANTRLRHEISASKEAIHNMLEILKGNTDRCKKLQEQAIEQAIEILTELALGPTDKTEDFVKTLGRIFLDKELASRLRRKAGEAIAKLLSTKSASGLSPIMEIFCKGESMDAFSVLVDQLVDVLVNDEECQISAAEILEHLCFQISAAEILFRSEPGCDQYFDQLPNQHVINILTKIIRIILSTKIERKADEGARLVSCNIAEDQSAGAGTRARAGVGNNFVIGIDVERQFEERKLVAALISLRVVICDKLIDANDSCFVVPMERALVEKLKDIIDRNNDTTADCLRIVKLTCQVVIAMMKLKPSCIKEFNKNKFDEVLSKALKTLTDPDNCMLFAGNDRELTKPATSLASLVKEAHQLFNNAQ